MQERANVYAVSRGRGMGRARAKGRGRGRGRGRALVHKTDVFLVSKFNKFSYPARPL